MGDNFDNASLFAAKTDPFWLQFTSLRGADLRGTRWNNSEFTQCDLTGAQLQGATGLAEAIWFSTICPDGTNSDTNGGTCVGH